MTYLVYPRLPYGPSQRRLEEISGALRSGGIHAVQAMASSEHSRAEPVATGGRIASADHIASVRSATTAAVAPWLERGSVGRTDASRFDLALASALHTSLSIVPGDAAHDETWNFLTLVVLPDIAVLRFPEMHPDRFFGTNRNVLRRAWLRRDTLGDLTDSSERPLGEDEMVGLFERSSMSRNRDLVRAAARTVMAFDGQGARSEWARELYKEIRYVTGPRALEGIDEDDLINLIVEEIPIARTSARVGNPPIARDEAARSVPPPTTP